ncbi:D-alanyl-D-alanine carboxypeptidase precursor (plasmid) [Aquisphaera giovannonii]|uniref:D-alanyl-D-alanine carboxypeptidase n=1 Tax=Aquisphaera giovannonii TaxID=406548 RepID=A0A5B9WG35_9BACT|nr:serine hydrolase domain-containing protein [Aquisphaera giovannonii]QEH39239.1 D-alanyl-D-alanine carboxypeptidase precursor [Aquisphaera giovannonii]
MIRTTNAGRKRRANRSVPSVEPLEGREMMTAGTASAAAIAAAASPQPGEISARPASPAAVPTDSLRLRDRLSPRVVRMLRAEIARQMAADNLPSVAVGIWIPGAGRFLAIRGDANLETGRRRGLPDPFRIASITKAFTATAVLQLVDRGRLSVTDPLARWYPDFPNAANITVDDLLRMRSGIPDTVDAALPEYFTDPTIRLTPEDFMARAAAMPGAFRPAGVETVYNNLNYLFLQEIVRKETGRDLGVQIRRSILRPLGMAHTLYPRGDRLPGPLHGYSLVPETGRLIDRTVLNPGVAGGAGAMISTMHDLRIFARALGTGSLLSPSSRAAQLQGSPLAHAPEFLRYGEGVELLGPFVGHNGTIFGFSSEMFYLPALKATIVVNVSRLDLDDVSRATPLFLSLSKIVFPDYVLW